MAYIAPQTTVTEITSTSVQPLIGSESNVCLIGLAGSPGNSLAVLTTTDTILLSGTDPVVLPTIAALNNDAQLTGVTSVIDVLNPGVGSPIGTGYVQDTDFQVALGEGPPDGSDATIARIAEGNMPNGTLVAVTYTYVPSNYYNPIRLFDIGSVESRFGPSYAQSTNPATGQVYYTGIASQLSFAARMAFANGAQSVICQPLFTRATPGDPSTAQQTPAAGAVGDEATWSDTLNVLRPISDIDIIVPIIGEDGVNVSDDAVLTVFSTVQTHLAYMNSQQVYIEAILGEDGTSSQNAFQTLLGGSGSAVTGASAGSVQAHAAALQSNFANGLSSQCVLINNTVFQVATPGGFTNSLNVGGQYAAAAVAGALSSRPVSSSLTHSPILGFQGVTDPRATSDKDSDASAGLFVIENYQGIIRCRHGITLDVADGPVRQELSVVLAKFLLEESIRQTIDNQIIGQVIADSNSPMVVGSAITGVLSILQQQGAIVGYTTPVTAISSITPTIITATFSYRPAFPIDYVEVSFNLDLTTGSVTSTLSGSTAS